MGIDHAAGEWDDPKHKVSGPGIIRTIYSTVSFNWGAVLITLMAIGT